MHNTESHLGLQKRIHITADGRLQKMGTEVNISFAKSVQLTNPNPGGGNHYGLPSKCNSRRQDVAYGQPALFVLLTDVT
jgi:hypothetical protein